MSDYPLIRGELPFPEAGEGVVLRFTNPDCEQLQKKFGENWFQDAFARLNRTDIDFIKFCFDVGCKRDGKPARIKFDDCDVPIVALSNPILDALYIAVLGRKFEDHLAYMEEKHRLAAIEQSGKAADEGNL